MKVVPRSAERQNRAGARRDFENVRNTNSGALNNGDWPAVLRPLSVRSLLCTMEPPPGVDGVVYYERGNVIVDNIPPPTIIVIG